MMLDAGPLAIAESADQHGLRIAPIGELDIATEPLLTERLRAAQRTHRTVLLDLSQLAFIDSTGLAAILAALRDASDGGCELQIGPELAPQVRRLLDLTGVGHLFGLDLRFAA